MPMHLFACTATSTLDSLLGEREIGHQYDCRSFLRGVHGEHFELAVDVHTLSKARKKTSETAFDLVTTNIG